MVYWITGRSGAGKTRLAYRIAEQTRGIVIDGDEVRKLFPATFTDEDRKKHIMQMAQMAQLLEPQVTVIVACLSPRRQWRAEAQVLFKECIEIFLPHGQLWTGTEYEEPFKENFEKGKVMPKPKEKKIVLLKDIVVPKGTIFTYIPDGSNTEYGNGNYECFLSSHKNSAPHFVIGDELLKLLPEQFAEVK